MDFGTTTTSTTHSDSSPPADVSRPPPGFYMAGSSVFYVAGGASVFLLRTADEPACLHPCRALPSGATGATYRVGPTLELLARTADQLCRPSGLLGSVQAEVRRDRIMAVGAAIQASLECISAEIGSLLMDEGSPDPGGFHERLTERLHTIQEQRRCLSNQRVNSRGERANNPPAPPYVPLAAAAFVHRGEYVGRYPDMASAGAAITGRTLDAAPFVRDAHMRGELWTVSRDGMVYVFRCPSAPA